MQNPIKKAYRESIVNSAELMPCEPANLFIAKDPSKDITYSGKKSDEKLALHTTQRYGRMSWVTELEFFGSSNPRDAEEIVFKHYAEPPHGSESVEIVMCPYYVGRLEDFSLLQLHSIATHMRNTVMHLR